MRPSLIQDNQRDAFSNPTVNRRVRTQNGSRHCKTLLEDDPPPEMRSPAASGNDGRANNRRNAQREHNLNTLQPSGDQGLPLVIAALERDRITRIRLGLPLRRTGVQP